MMRQLVKRGGVMGVLGIIFASLAFAEEEVTKEDLLEVQRRFQKVLGAAKEATVCVQLQGGSGSGVIVSEEGHILSAAHVLREPDRIVNVILSNGRNVRAKTLGIFPQADAGMAQIIEEGPWPFSPMHLVAELPEKGAWCFAIGHPGRLDEKRGAVVRLGKVLSAQPFLMHSDCELLMGDSGGPLFDLEGRVIAIHSRIGPSIDQNAHVPIGIFNKHWEGLSKVGVLLLSGGQDRGGYFGVHMQNHKEGVFVTRVHLDTAAEKAGIEQGDFITQVDGVAMKNTFDFSHAIGTKKPGTKVKIHWKRDGETFSAEVILGRRPGS